MSTDQKIALVAAIGSCVGALAVFVAVWQLRVQQQNVKAELVRQRRANAIGIVATFNSNFTRSWMATVRLIGALSFDELNKLHAGEPVAVRGELFSDLLGAHPSLTIDTDAKAYLLQGDDVLFLRFQALEILNAVEIVCASVIHEVADNEIIVPQIKFLHEKVPPDNLDFMHTFRQVVQEQEYFPNTFLYMRRHHGREANT